MFPSLRIARIAGIDLSIHWTFWLLPLWVAFTVDDVSVLPVWMHVFLLVPLFACIALHEYGHALTAKQFGIRTRSITLSPLGGIASLERMSDRPWEEFWIAIAGPLVNVVIAILLGIGLGIYAGLDAEFTSNVWWRFFGILFLANVVLVVFNMIPAFPMDGGRVLRSILAGALGMLPGTRIAVLVGTFFAILMGAAGMLVLGNPWLILISLFVIWAGNQELAVLEMQARQRHYADEDAIPMVYPVSGRAGSVVEVTVCRWDPQRQTWVRQSYIEPKESAAV